MSATDELRRLLDERGVEWMDDSYAQLWCTVWHGQDGKQWRMTENQSGMLTELKAWKATPAQAIAATLGSGTCHNVVLAEMDEKAGKKYSMAMTALRFGGFMPEDEPAEFTCSACGKTALIDWETLYDIRFCPFCGEKVVDE